MATAANITKAEALARLNIAVFPVYVKSDPDNPFKTTKKPATPNGFYDATLDPGFVADLFEKHPNAEVGVWMGASGLVAGDIDVKRDPDGTVLVDGFEEFEKEWLDLPDTYSFDSISGSGGKQYIYLAPEGVTLGPAGNYRGIKGVDRRGGGSYSVWAGDVPKSRSVFAPAPDWLLDEATVRSAEKFEGTVKEWFDSLEPGPPSLIVRAAMDRTRAAFEKAGDDFDHAGVIERQFEAVRLGAEGHPGIPDLLQLIEELFFSRTGSHSRPEEEWSYEFQEGLASGIEKHGAAIQLRKDLPEYEIGMVPGSVRGTLYMDTPGDKNDFRTLLAALIPLVEDNLVVTSILWNCPKTRDISREWGLEFVYQRVLDARIRPEPVRENPALERNRDTKERSTKPVVPNNVERSGFLSDEEKSVVECSYTFIDRYLEADASKGFLNYAYAMPAAWTALSMAFGLKAMISKGVILGMNLWFLSLGDSGTGKTSEFKFLKYILDTMLRDGEGNYNLGAHSSPEGLHVELLTRDGKPSMIYHDEASSFFSALKSKDWASSLEYHFSDWYMGDVEPSNKISLKDLRGKSAKTSFNIHMAATPDRLLDLIDTSMFDTGFLARYNWTWADAPKDTDEQYAATQSDIDTVKGAPPVAFEVASDLSHAGGVLGSEPVSIWGTPEAVLRLEQGYKDFDLAAKSNEKYRFLKPAIKRLGGETIWKCASLLALYDGRITFELGDAILAVYYAEQWFRSLIQVVDTTSEGEFSKDVAAIETWIHSRGGMVTEAQYLDRFRSMIKFSQRELFDKIEFLRSSGRINRSAAQPYRYVLNDGVEREGFK